MNNRIYNELIEAQKFAPMSRSWKLYNYSDFVNNDFQLLRKFIKESTLETYTIIWRKTAREYIAYMNRGNSKYVYPVLDGVPINYFYNYTGLADNLMEALETFKEQKNPILRAHFMTNSYTTSIYDAELLLQMLTLDGFTYKIEYRDHDNRFIRFKISKEKIEAHMQKANELNMWIDRDEEDIKERQSLLRKLSD